MVRKYDSQNALAFPSFINVERDSLFFSQVTLKRVSLSVFFYWRLELWQVRLWLGQAVVVFFHAGKEWNEVVRVIHF